MTAVADSSKPQVLNPPEVFHLPTWSIVSIMPITSTTKLLTFAGQIGAEPDGTIPPDFKEQVRLAHKNALISLKAAGATPRDIIRVRHYVVEKTGNSEVDKLRIVDRGSSESWMKVLDQEAGGYRPPDTLLGVASLAAPELLYEFDIDAVITS